MAAIIVSWILKVLNSLITTSDWSCSEKC